MCLGCQQLEEELVSSKSEILRLSSALSSATDNNALLQHQLREMEAKYTSDLYSKDEALQTLNTDLERKSNTVALITQQYHQLRARFHQEIESHPPCTQCHHQGSEETDAISDTDEAQRTQYHQLRGLRLTPNPPPMGISRRPPATTQRRNFRRTNSSPAPFEVSSMTSIESSGTTRALPTPPISPKPLSYSSSPPDQLRRASKPLRRQQQGRSATSLSGHSKQPVKTLYRSDNTPLDPFRRQASEIVRSEISDIIESSKRQDHVSVKQPPPVLPPIELNEQIDSVSSQAIALSSSDLQSTPPTTTRKQHRHFILSKAQGLSSAPVRPMRVLCYNQARLDTAIEVAKEEKVIPDGVEGVLLVNKTKDNQWTELHHHQGTDR